MKRPKKYEDRPLWGVIADLRVTRKKYMRLALEESNSKVRMDWSAAVGYLKLAENSLITGYWSKKYREKNKKG